MLVYVHLAGALAYCTQDNMAKPLSELGRRERQIMDILVRRQRVTAAEVLADLPDQPSYSAVRNMLHLLEDKGYAAARARRACSKSLPRQIPHEDACART